MTELKSELVKYKNKLNGEIYYGTKSPTIQFIDGVKFYQVIDQNFTRTLLMKSEYLVKFT